MTDEEYTALFWKARAVAIAKGFAYIAEDIAQEVLLQKARGLGKKQKLGYAVIDALRILVGQKKDSDGFVQDKIKAARKHIPWERPSRPDGTGLKLHEVIAETKSWEAETNARIDVTSLASQVRKGRPRQMYLAAMRGVPLWQIGETFGVTDSMAHLVLNDVYLDLYCKELECVPNYTSDSFDDTFDHGPWVMEDERLAQPVLKPKTFYRYFGKRAA